MMVSPESYIERFKDAEYSELIKERDQLIQFIKDFEEKEIAGDRTGDDWMIKPSPEVKYQMYLRFLTKLCSLMLKKYKEEYVSKDRTLYEDAQVK